MRIAVLGAVQAERDGRPVDLGVRKQRALVTALAMTPGRPVPVPTLIDLLWPGGAPAAAGATLQSCVARLRRVLEPERAARSAAQVLVTVDGGYALRVPDDAVDAVRFERAIAAARRSLGHAAVDVLADGVVDVARARDQLAAARALWRGTPYAELGDAPAAGAERARLAELNLVAEELAATVRLAEGDAATLAADLEALIAEHPLRERLWALRAVALARAGRQADALGALREVRALLADELGVDPGSELRRVEEAVLRQDPAATASPVPAAAAPSSAPRAAQPAAPWPLVGRQPQLARLTALLDEADTGRPAFAALVGEPGIGKSRLAAELADRAAGRGWLALVGRCSQDDGAPPLWPWTAVLRELPGDELEPASGVGGSGGGDPEGERFRTWDAICRRLLTVAADRPLLVVLDDLHWADASSLRVLRHLVSTAEAGRLVVVGTWRRHPEPTGPLAEVAEALARRHALRLDLTGLGPDEAGALVTAVARVDAPDPELLRRRTEGNPFFLVEYARLLQDDAGTLDAVPAAVSDVLGRRLAGQPEETLTALRAAAVLGREVRLPVLAAVLERGDDAVLDTLDPALAAGLLVEDGVDRFRFSHALIRDAVYATLPLSRAARLHARAARAWAQREPQAVDEIARHWLAAGPPSAAEAWPAAVAAAAAATGLHAHEEARDLLRAALDAQGGDPAAGRRERYDVLMALAESCRLAADWTGLEEATEAAVATAEAAGDVAGAARAAVGTSTGALWQPRRYGAIHPPAIAALRRALAALPPGDSELRCRVMCALAGELYLSAAPKEREALVEQAVAMARRLGDPHLLQDALTAAYLFDWRPATAERRLAQAGELLDLAATTGDRRALATAATLQTIVLFELGRIAEHAPSFDRARALAEEQRMAYLLLVLDTMAAPWLAMRGRAAEADAVLARALETADRTSLPQAHEGVVGAVLTVRLFQGRLAEALPALRDLAPATGLPITAVVAALLLRTGLRAEAEQALATLPPVDLAPDDWFAMVNWAAACEVAAGAGDAELGAAAYARLAPYAGRMCVGGSGAPLGPAHAFLALAAAATGEIATATRHADAALEQCAAWQIPPVAQWLHDQRDRHGF